MFSNFEAPDWLLPAAIWGSIVVAAIFLSSLLWGDLAEGGTKDHELTWWLMPFNMLKEVVLGAFRMTTMKIFLWLVLILAIVIVAVPLFVLAMILLFIVGIGFRLARLLLEVGSLANELYGPRKRLLPGEEGWL